MGQSTVLAQFVTAMLGATTAMIVLGLGYRFETTFTQVGTMATVLPAAVLLALAIGVRVPQTVAVWVCMSAWRRFASKGTPTGMGSILLEHGAADRPLYWLVLSVVTLAAGLLTAVLPVTASLASITYDWFQGHFVWSTAPLMALQIVTVFIASGLALTVLGLAIACAHHLACRFGQWEPSATAWTLIGGTCGALVAGSMIAGGSRADLILVAAALPALLAAITSVSLSARDLAPTQKQRVSSSVPLPAWSDAKPRLLRAGIVMLGVGGVATVTAWCSPIAPHTMSRADFPLLLLFAGIGVLTGSGSRRLAERSLGGFGTACAFAGLTIAIPALFVQQSHSSGGTHLWPNLLALFGVGFAATYGLHTILNRVASRSRVGVTLLGRLLTGCGLVMLIGVPAGAWLVGLPATIRFVGLVLLVLGATLVLNEPNQSERTLRVRLGVMAVATAGVILCWLWYPVAQASVS